MRIKEPTLFRVRLLENTAYNDIDDILNIKMVGENGWLYYYDSMHRWCYLDDDKAYERLPDVKKRPKREDFSI